MLQEHQIRQRALPTTSVLDLFPTAIARATPAILPVPTVAASAVDTAWNADISPSPPEFLLNIFITVFLINQFAKTFNNQEGERNETMD